MTDPRDDEPEDEEVETSAFASILRRDHDPPAGDAVALEGRERINHARRGVGRLHPGGRGISSTRPEGPDLDALLSFRPWNKLRQDD